jgi:glutathione reductase (NADPH)
VLVGAAEVLDWNRRMGEHGIRTDQVRIDWPRLMQFKRSFTESVPKNSEASFVKSGVATFHGRARFVGPATLQVGDHVLEATHVVVAAGSKPVDLKNPWCRTRNDE